MILMFIRLLPHLPRYGKNGQKEEESNVAKLPKVRRRTIKTTAEGSIIDNHAKRDDQIGFREDQSPAKR